MTEKMIKFLKITLIVVLALSLSLLLAACGEPEKGDKGDKGGDGKSAYELYKEHFGYGGSEEQWLKDLVEGNLTATKTYTLSFDSNGGSDVRDIYAGENTSVYLPVPTKDGMVFGGWYADGVKAQSPFTVTADMEFTAEWKEMNPDEQYDYYAVKYGFDEESRVIPMTFVGVTEMFQTSGNYLLYVDSEDSGAISRFNILNGLAEEWNVMIHHFNPDLSGGYAADDTEVQNTNMLDTHIDGEIKALQDYFAQVAGKAITDIPDHSILAVSGAAPSASGELTEYNGEIVFETSYDNAADAIASIAMRKPSYAQNAQDGNTPDPEAYNTGNINVMNVYGDSDLHMYQDYSGNDVNGYIGEKTDVYRTVATYRQLADLLNNNDGTFALVLGNIGGVSTQAIAKLTNELALDYGMKKIYFFNPRLDGGVRIESDGKTSWLVPLLNTVGDDDGGFIYNYLYARFIDEFLPGYQSAWNYGQTITITANGAQKEYSKPVVPTVMLFDGSGDGAAKFVGAVEGEYTYENVNAENGVVKDAWSDAIKYLFNKNTYASYNPFDHTDDDGGSSVPSAPAADAGGC